MIKIGDFSKLSRVSVRMLRHYDELSLLKPIHVDKFSSYRYYSAEQLSVVSKIQVLKDMGFSLSVIKEILSAYSDNDSLRNYLKIQHSQMKQEVETAERRLLLLETALNRIGDDGFMRHAVNIKDIPQRYVASLRKVIPSYQDEGMLWEQMTTEAKPQSIQMANPSYGLAVFHDEGYKEADVDVEIQIALTGTYKNTENVRFLTVPAVTVASAIVKGGYDQLTPVNESIAAWVVDNGYDFNGAMFCIYHISPGHDPNPDNWVTEVCYPVKKK